MNIDFTNLTFNESTVKNMEAIDSCFYDGIVELRKKANKFYICCVWESSNEFTINGRFLCELEARKEFLKWKKKIA